MCFRYVLKIFKFPSIVGNFIFSLCLWLLYLFGLSGFCVSWKLYSSFILFFEEFNDWIWAV